VGKSGKKWEKVRKSGKTGVITYFRNSSGIPKIHQHLPDLMNPAVA
jgi:hypothetical protein